MQVKALRNKTDPCIERALRPPTVPMTQTMKYTFCKSLLHLVKNNKRGDRMGMFWGEGWVERREREESRGRTRIRLGIHLWRSINSRRPIEAATG